MVKVVYCHYYLYSKDVSKSFSDIIKQLDNTKLNYVDNLTSIFITDSYDESAGSFFNYIKLNRILPKQVLIISVIVENYPYISANKCFELTELTAGFTT